MVWPQKGQDGERGTGRRVGPLRAAGRRVQSRGSRDGDRQIGTGSSIVEVQPHCPLAYPLYKKSAKCRESVIRP